MHYHLVVLVPPDTFDLYAEIERLLAPYDYELKVDEYETECWCVMNNRSSLVHEEFVRLGAPQAEESRWSEENPLKLERLRELQERHDPPLTDAEVAEYHAIKEDIAADYQRCQEPHNLVYWEAHQRIYAKPELARAEADCEDCNGTGLMKSTVPPEAKYDYWNIGGRYRGYWSYYLKSEVAKPKPPPASSETSAAPQPSFLQRMASWYRRNTPLREREYDVWEDDKENIIPVKDLLEDCPTPYALVTPDGKWHQWDESPLHPIAVRREKDDEWDELCRRLYEENSDCLAIVCDYHS